MNKASQKASCYRYPGTRPFYDNEIDRCLFFGRDQEKDSFLYKVLANNLVVLYARSGLGKTSLINAGLKQALRDKGCIPLMIRLNNPDIDPIQDIYRGIEGIAKQEHLDYEKGNENTLWQYFKTVAFWSSRNKLLKPVLILDQFEEFFMLYLPETRRAFINQLADLVNNNIPDEVLAAHRPGETFPYSDRSPNVKIVISIREDYLGSMEEMAGAISGILDNRFRLLPLNSEQARQAIVEPCRLENEIIRAAPFTFRPKAVDMILEFLCKQIDMGKIKRTDEVESFQLQLLCRHIEEHKVREKKESGKVDIIIEPGDLGGEKGLQEILERFYDDSIEEFEDEDIRKRIRELCEEGLISVVDSRLSLEKEEIERKFNVSEDILAQLVNSRLLRAEPRVGSIYYELSHDNLIAPIRKSQQKYKEISYIEPGNPEAYKKLALLYIRNEEPLKAVEIYRQAINVDPEYADIYEDLSIALIEMGAEKSAEDICKCAIKSGSKNALLYLSLGYHYHKVKKYDKAIEAFQKAYELDRENTSIKVNLTENYLLVKQFEKAYSLANELFEEKNIPAAEKLAVHFIAYSSLLFQGERDEADTHAKKLIDFYNSLPEESRSGWSYSEIENFIRENKELPEPDNQRLLQMIRMLDPSLKQGDQKVIRLG